jgi:pimeloyl-ACP methyl ester carboxylesterase
MARYLLLKHYTGGPEPMPDNTPMDQWTPREISDHMAFMGHVAEKLRERGEYVDAQALSPEGAFVRYDGDGHPPVTDGPFAETKDLIAGWFAIDVESEERAYEVAALVSSAPGAGGRPIQEWIAVPPGTAVPVLPLRALAGIGDRVDVAPGRRDDHAADRRGVRGPGGDHGTAHQPCQAHRRRARDRAHPRPAHRATGAVPDLQRGLRRRRRSGGRGDQAHPSVARRERRARGVGVARTDAAAPRPTRPAALNRAVALGQVDGPLAGLRALDTVPADVPRRTAVSAHLHERAGDLALARDLYVQAARAATNAAERDHLSRRAARLNLPTTPTTPGATASATAPAGWPRPWGAAVGVSDGPAHRSVRCVHRPMSSDRPRRHIIMETHTLKTDDVDLVYDVHGPLPPAGRRPPLLAIGQPMDASGFVALAAQLPDRTVVAYDPRGLGRSVRTDGRIDNVPEVQATDVHALITELDAGPVELFASSGGAVTALALVAAHPGDVVTLVAHEPPLLSVLPDADAAARAWASVRDAYDARGWGAGMAAFIAMTSWRGEFTDAYFAQPTPDPAAFGMPATDDGARDDPLLSDRSTAIIVHRPDVVALRAAATRIVVAVGEESLDTFTGRTAVATAELLGQEATVFPSHHGGFLGDDSGYPGQPEAFARKLRDVLAGSRG